MTTPDRKPPDSTRPRARLPGRARSASRAVALFVLVPTVPLLLLSVAALAAFYLAPERFAALLERLPGTEFLRVALIFSPATLFGVVLLAVLYALEPEAARVEAPARTAPTGVPLVRLVASMALAIGLPLLLLSSAAWVLSFVAPGRFGLLAERLPGTALLTALLPYLPIILLIACAVAALVLTRGAAWRLPQLPDLTRWSVRLILFASLPLLALTLGGLGLFYAQPEWGERLVAKLGVTAFVRIGLVFAPAVLVALVGLASLYLARTRTVRVAAGDGARTDIVIDTGVRYGWATWTLIVALAASSLAALGVTLAVIYLLLR